MSNTEKQKWLSAFNAELKAIMNEVARLMPEDAEVARVRKRVSLMITLTPLFIIKRLGPELLVNEEYLTKDAIANGAAEIFLDEGFVPRRPAAVAEIPEGVTSEDRAAAKAILPRVRRALRDAGEDVRSTIMVRCARMLDHYLNWGSE